MAVEPDDGPLDAGELGSWLAEHARTSAEGRATAVPCGTCTACCTASQFVHIGPSETDTLAHIPPELLFPAPLLPRGQMVLGYDEQGRCPMLGEHGCTIYEHRPRTCRTYDCRVFTAAEVRPDDDGLARRARRWRFRASGPEDAVRARAITRAAAALDRIAEAEDGLVPASPTQRAVLAVELHERFVGRDPTTGSACDATPTDRELEDVLRRWSPVR